MRRLIRVAVGSIALVTVATIPFLDAAPATDQASPRAASSAAATGAGMTPAECTAARLGATIASSAIGEPVRGVTLSAPSWVEAANGIAAHCRVNGSIALTREIVNAFAVAPFALNSRACRLGRHTVRTGFPDLGQRPPELFPVITPDTEPEALCEAVREHLRARAGESSAFQSASR